MANELRGGLIKIRGERADGLTHKICEERVDGLILKIDGVRVQRLTHTISEERADGLSQRLVDDDGTAKVVGVDGPTQVPLHVSEEH